MSISPGIFRQYDIRGIVDVDLTLEAARAVGRGFAALLQEHNATGPVVVGRDNRPSGGALRDALVAGLTESGRDVIDIGVVPTPTVYWALHHVACAGGIQITGSHNPPEFNGFKISVGTSSVHGEGIQHLRQLIASGALPSGAGTVRTMDLLGAYVDDLVAKTGPLQRPMRIVYDCGNGVGAVAAPQLFERLGVQSTALFADSDGTFPNHHPDPTVEENLVDLIRQVRADGAEIGIGFDGDADRIGIVDGDGTVIWGDNLLILFARDVLARTGTGQAIIFDVKCSQTLPDAITAAGGEPVMWKTGHSLIKEQMKVRGAPVAGEMSGHMFFAEGFYGHDDALYAAARLLRILSDSGKTVKELLANVPRLVSTPELRVDCADDRKFDVVARAVAHFAARYPVNDIDGVRILFGDGWGLIRASNTQPVLVMRFEAPTTERLAAMRSEVATWLRSEGIGG
jgi:phosphomannomutase/phosphoglucomutase